MKELEVAKLEAVGKGEGERRPATVTSTGSKALAKLNSVTVIKFAVNDDCILGEGATGLHDIEIITTIIHELVNDRADRELRVEVDGAGLSSRADYPKAKLWHDNTDSMVLHQRTWVGTPNG